jgi:predicted RNA-binding Zn-ribbon protein involved in translation (DUF1610 family)
MKMDHIANPKKKQKNMRTNKPCDNCSAQMEVKRTTLHFERTVFYADVENVLVYICPNCGTRSIPGPTARRMSRMADDLFRSANEPAQTEQPILFTGISMHRVAS